MSPKMFTRVFSCKFIYGLLDINKDCSVHVEQSQPSQSVICHRTVRRFGCETALTNTLLSATQRTLGGVC